MELRQLRHRREETFVVLHRVDARDMGEQRSHRRECRARCAPLARAAASGLKRVDVDAVDGDLGATRAVAEAEMGFQARDRVGGDQIRPSRQASRKPSRPRAGRSHSGGNPHPCSECSRQAASVGAVPTARARRAPRDRRDTSSPARCRVCRAAISLASLSRPDAIPPARPKSSSTTATPALRSAST